MLVLDASAAIDLLLRTPRGSRVAHQVRADDLIAPELVDVEVCSAVARLQRDGTVERTAADAAVRRLATLPVRRIPHRLLLTAAWALRDRVRVADAFYVACASMTAGTLLTCDARLSAASLPDVAVTVVR